MSKHLEELANRLAGATAPAFEGFDISAYLCAKKMAMTLLPLIQELVDEVNLREPWCHPSNTDPLTKAKKLGITPTA